MTPRERFVTYVRSGGNSPPVVSPFLPHPTVIRDALCALNLPVREDAAANELTLAAALEYQPMFMTEMAELIFPWRTNPERSTPEWALRYLDTPAGRREFRSRPGNAVRNDGGGRPVRGGDDHRLLVAACASVHDREPQIRDYFRSFRQRVGDGGRICRNAIAPAWTQSITHQ